MIAAIIIGGLLGVFLLANRSLVGLTLLGFVLLFAAIEWPVWTLGVVVLSVAFAYMRVKRRRQS